MTLRQIRPGTRVRLVDLSDRRGMVTHVFAGNPPNIPATVIVALDRATSATPPV